MSCLELTIGKQKKGNLQIGSFSTGDFIIGEQPSAEFSVIPNTTGSLDIDDESSHMDFEIHRVGNTFTMTLGLVCGTNIGMPILYASDGKLITIDGKYLLVRRS